MFHALFEGSTWAGALFYGAVLTALAFAVDFYSLPSYPDSIPVVGYGRGFWGQIKNSFGYVTKQRAWLREGYEKYNKKGLPFLIPGGPFRSHDLVLPRNMLGWLAKQPESVIDGVTAHNVMMCGDCNFLGPSIPKQRLGARAIWKYLHRNLSELTPAIEAEIKHAMDKSMGHITDWESLNLWGFWTDIVGPVSNLLIVGSGVCRDKDLLEVIARYSRVLFFNIMILRLFPSLTHPLVARLLTISNWLEWRRAHKVVGPVIQHRLDSMRRHARGDVEFRDWTPPRDLITWIIQLATEENPEIQLSPELISKHLLPIEFASYETTIATGSLWLQDLVASPSAVDAITQEIKNVQASNSGSWSKEALSKLSLVDSSIRESQRLKNIHLTLIERFVMPKEGVRLPGTDWTIPKGALLAANLDGCHHDEDLYKNADQYDPFRFSNVTGIQEDLEDLEEKTDGENVKQLGLVTMTPYHLSFGHGRFVCPGRFFIADLYKLVAVKLFLEFDVKEDWTPVEKWIGPARYPHPGRSIKIRRKSSKLD